jgi:hypothetical protein
MKIKSLLIAATAALAASRVFAFDIDAQSATFTKLANGIIAQTVAGKIDVAAVQADTATMEKIAAEFAEAYKAKFPSGAKLADFMLASKDSLTGMTLEAIDAGFESDAINKAHGKEIGFDLTAEENEHFGNMVDLFVHPATAAICAGLWEKDHSAERLKRMQSELQEVIEHCRKVSEKLKK